MGMYVGIVGTTTQVPQGHRMPHLTKSTGSRNSMGKYTIVLLDHDGTPISERYADTIGEARKAAKCMLDDMYATSAETTHEAWGTHKVEVTNTQTGECLYDYFY